MLQLFQLNRNIRSSRRYLHIARVLFKYGFDQLLEYLNLAHLAARGRKFLRRAAPAVASLSAPERMRMAFEELGPTFVKLGQLLSTRPDVIPGEYVREFSKLQDMVPSFPFDEVRAQVLKELGGEPEQFFSWIDPVPIAAASIAQVHRACLAGGEDVVVKVRRPGVVGLVETDIDALMALAMLADKHLPASDIYDPIGLVKEFAHTIRREMDLVQIGRAHV